MDVSKEIQKNIIAAVKTLYDLDLNSIDLEHPENEAFGDYSANIAMVLSKELKQSPMDIAKNLCYELNSYDWLAPAKDQKIKIIQSIEVARPGFINFKLDINWLKYVLFIATDSPSHYRQPKCLLNKRIVVEYTDPNPFKIFHIGHLMTNCIGESLARIFESSGALVKRANYQGDVGMHVAKSIFGLVQLLQQKAHTLNDLQNLSLIKRIEYLGSAYTYGANAFETSDSDKEIIKDINKQIYMIAQEMLVEKENWTPLVQYGEVKLDADLYSRVKELYIAGRAWSLEYFETLYKRLGTGFDYYYFESKVGEYGYKIVKDNLAKDIFTMDNGAVIYDGARSGLHTRVFVNSLDLPVYEAKDLGLAFLKFADYKYDQSFIVTGNEINEYFKVVIAAMHEISPELAEKTTHLGHGMMRLKSGKMSSRTGNVISGDGLLNKVKDFALEKMDLASYSDEEKQHIADCIAVASIKYAILKNGIGNDIAYSEEDVLDVKGNTGSYLLYTYARAHSVLEKASFEEKDIFSYAPADVVLEEKELDVLRTLYKFNEVVEFAAKTYAPNSIAHFVFLLAQKFNSYYGEVNINNSENSNVRFFRLHLTYATSQVIKQCLNLLGIQTVDRM